MFLFIAFLPKNHRHMIVFKYISCSYLSRRKAAADEAAIMFKYISCSYLSNNPRLFVIMLVSLNTSHVLIYLLEIGAYYGCTVMFKYISCSYLSIIYQKVKSGTLFKYISCSYLSATDFWDKKEEYCLNTSHVLIYPALLSLICNRFPGLNTSHVLIYHYNRNSSWYSW